MKTKSAARPNWGVRVGAVVGSVVTFVAFWQLAAHTPHPANFGAGNPIVPTPTDSFAVPTNNQGSPIDLPGSPHSGTGLSH